MLTTTDQLEELIKDETAVELLRTDMAAVMAAIIRDHEGTERDSG